jgi:FMN phosphatase YigB (HAD superfamily)
MIRQMSVAVEKLDWDHIETVLLDLDGTLFGLGFDNDFWLDFIPGVYAASQALTAVREVEPFDLQRSLFVDDSPPVLRAAQASAIKWVRGVRRSSVSRGGQGRPARDYGDIPAVDSVSDLDPGLP